MTCRPNMRASARTHPRLQADVAEWRVSKEGADSSSKGHDAEAGQCDMSHLCLACRPIAAGVTTQKEVKPIVFMTATIF